MIVTTPYFQDCIFNNLPEPLKQACAAFTSRRERDLYLLAQLTTLSAFSPNVHGKYRGDTVYLNFFTFIIAPPASGKGKMVLAKKTVTKSDQAFFNSLEINEKFIKSLFISGNISSSVFIDKLQANSGLGIMFESEADTVSQILMQDWGGMSDLFRKAFSNEEISKTRKGELKEISIPKPKLAICLSGTPNQLPSFIPSVENGLFSRFVYYSFSEEKDFENPKPSLDQFDSDTFIDEIGTKLLEIFNFIGKEPLYINLSDEDWDSLTNYMQQWHQYSKNKGEDFRSVVIRYGLIHYKIAMLLTLIRAGANKTLLGSTLLCTKNDFYIAQNIVHTLLQHAVIIYDSYKGNHDDLGSRDLNKLHALLPTEVDLTKAQIDALWATYGFSSRTSYNRINDLINNQMLEKLMNNKYRVITTNSNTDEA